MTIEEEYGITLAVNRVVEGDSTVEQAARAFSLPIEVVRTAVEHDIRTLEQAVINAAVAYREAWGAFTRGQSQSDGGYSRTDAYIGAHNTLLTVTDCLIEERKNQ